MTWGKMYENVQECRCLLATALRSTRSPKTMVGDRKCWGSMSQTAPSLSPKSFLLYIVVQLSILQPIFQHFRPSLSLLNR